MDNPKLNDGMKKFLQTSGSPKFQAFQGMKIDSATFLDEIPGRERCAGCSKSRKFFCYTCYVPMPLLEARIPKVKVSLELRPCSILSFIIYYKFIL